MLPFLVALTFSRKQFWKVYLIMMATMIVDIDHLLATPIYVPERCSIGFHPLHTTFPIIAYFIMCFFKPTRWIGIGLVIHMLLDASNCL